MFRTAMFAMLAALVALPVLAETVYVDDTLRVGVRRNANSSESPLTVVTSGARLEVLERGARYWRVRTEDGVEGWVGASYVTPHPPASVQLEELKAENARLKDELQARVAEENLAVEFAALQRQYQRLQEQLAAQAQPSSLGWIIAALLVALLVVGFLLGKRHERDRVVRRFNGLEL